MSTASNNAPFSTGITLTLDTAPENNSPVIQAPTQDNSETAEIKEMESNFSAKELEQINAFCDQIDITNAQLVMQYAAAPQKKIANFSDSALEKVRNKDVGEVGDMLVSLIDDLNDFSADDTDFAGKSARKIRKIVSRLKSKFSNVSTNIETIVNKLEEHQLVLLQDISMLEGLYNSNLHYFKELSMYILAGKKRLQELRSTKLQELREKAETSSEPHVAQMYKDYSDACDRFEKKLHDLSLSRTVSMQMGAQIRLLQSNDSALAEKIHSTIVNTIPLWKSQMVIALGLANTMSAMEAQREVTNMTNSLLRSNAAKLKQATVDVARENERGIIDIETLTETNKMLIDTITEVQEIQANGREQRRAAEAELKILENDLMQKLRNQ